MLDRADVPEQIEQVARFIWLYKFNLFQLPFVNQGGWPVGEDGRRVVLSDVELDRAMARAISIRAAEGNPTRDQLIAARDGRAPR